MAVTEETPIASSVANGVTTSFPHSFTVLDSGDLVVTGTLSNVTTTYVLGVDYTLTGVASSSGSVEFISPPANGTIVTRYRDIPLERSTDYQENGDLLAATVNSDIDRLWFALQDIFNGGKVVPTCVRAPNGETLNALPSAAARAGYFLGFDGSGQPSLLSATAGTALALSADLANASDALKGDNLSAVKRTETGAEATTLHFYIQRSKLRLTDFLTAAECDDIISDTGSVDVTTKFASALTASAGKSLILPSGTIKVSAALNLSANNSSLVGDGIRATKILGATNNVPILNITGTFVQVEGLKVGFSVSPLSGATGIKVVAQNTHLNDILVETTHTGIQFGAGGAISGTLNTAGGCRMRTFQILDHTSCGLLLWGTVDTFIRDGLINAASTSKASLGNIRILDGNEAWNLSDMDVLLGVYALTMDAAVNSIGTRPAYGRFVNVYFDSAAQNADVRKTVESDFIGTWFSNGRSGGGFNGLSLFDCDSIDFLGGSAFNCGADGVYVDGTCRRIGFTGFKAESNSVTAGSGVKHGIEFGTGCTDFSVVGGVARNGLGGSANQAYGIALGSGCTNYNIQGVNTRNNVSGGIFDGANDVTGVISDCKGFVTQNGGNTTVTVGNSSTTVTHGLAGTPTLDQISLLDNSSRAASGINSVWVDNITSTTFRVNTNTNVTTTAFAFSWRARIKGA